MFQSVVCAGKSSGGMHPDTTDVVGNASYAAGFVAYDDRNGNMLFRMRLDRDPGNNLQSVWQILIDSDSDSDVDWVLQLDESGDNQVELVAATTGGSTFDDVVLSSTVTWSGATATYSTRWSAKPGAVPIGFGRISAPSGK